MENQWAVEFLEWCDKYEIEVPRSERELLSLEKLMVNGKPITSIHPHIIKLKKLEKLQITNGNLKTLPQLPSSIRKLAIAKNPFGEVPNSIRKLRDLETLLIEGCDIRRLPSWMRNFKRLSQLKMDNNRLESIEELRGMESIKLLTFEDNQVKDFSPIYSLKNLETLNFSKNQIKKFDKRVRELKKLKFFIGCENGLEEYDSLFMLNGYKTFINIYSDKVRQRESFLFKISAYIGENYQSVAKILASVLLR